MTNGAFRVAAFGIAALAAVDPAISSSRASRPTVAVVALDPVANAALADRVVQVLDRHFTVVRAPFDASAATVVVGHAVPNDAATFAGPLFSVVPAESSPLIRQVSVVAPPLALVNARTPVHVTIETVGMRGQSLDVQLRAGGVLVDRSTQPVLIDSGRVEFTRHGVWASTGPQLLVVSASIGRATAADSAFQVVDVRDDRFPVLFHDPRPSWSSTFVRRAVEEDPRFVVTHRVVTSSGVANTSGAAPLSLRDPASLSSFSTIVVSSPETLTRTEIDALETFMRRRGGRVVVLMDAGGTGQVDRLTGASDWRTSRSTTVSTMPDVNGFGALRGKETSWPAALPAGAAIHTESVARDSARRPIVWSVPVGAGRLLMSGALDAWQHRSDSSGFNAFWTNTIAEFSSGAPAAIIVDLSRRALRPGESVQGRVAVLEPFLSEDRSRTASVGAALVSDRDSTIVRFWPDNSPGVFTGTVVAPRRPGAYRLVVWSGRDRGEASIVVEPGARSSSRDERAVIEAFVSSRGGRVIDEKELGALPDRLSSAIQVVSRVESWHPMRSPWWIAPFALFLGAEWWWRRRKGLA